MSPTSLAGVDGCKAGWLYVASGQNECLSAFVAPSIDALVSRLPDDCLVEIDAPIAVPTNDSRAA